MRWGAWHSLVNNATFCAINFSQQLLLLSTALFKMSSKFQSVKIDIHDTVKYELMSFKSLKFFILFFFNKVWTKLQNLECFSSNLFTQDIFPVSHHFWMHTAGPNQKLSITCYLVFFETNFSVIDEPALCKRGFEIARVWLKSFTWWKDWQFLILLSDFYGGCLCQNSMA